GRGTGAAPTPGLGVGAPRPTPVMALRVPPAGAPAPPLVSSRQVAEVLEAAAARRRDLNARVGEAESAVVRLDAEVVSADAALTAIRSENEEVLARVASAEAERSEHERASFSVPVPSPVVVQEPPRPAAPRRNPVASLWNRAVNLGRSIVPEPPASAVIVPDGVRAREEARRRQAELSLAVTDLRQQLAAGQQAATAAEAGVAAKTAELEEARRTLAVARAALSAAIADVTFGPAALAATLGAGSSASDVALADIPADYLRLYQSAAAACPGLSWTVLAAVGAIESAHGRAAMPGVREGANYAGAMGPMQFLAPTWAAYGLDADGDGTADVYNPADAVYGAANYLCASGAGDPGRLGGALWAYNHADWYVRDVLDLATRYGGASLRTTTVDGAQLLANPNLVVTPEAAADLAAGRVDRRVVAALGAILARHRIKVSVFQTGHSMYVRGTDRVSNHYYGRAVDIYEIDGAPVSGSNNAAFELAVALLTAESSLRPDELGSPWPQLSQFPGAFSDADHLGHLHLGWRAPYGPTAESQP
ncbi:MAG: lytic transglycosylase domain-containing protein, partial [Actinomycetota bacterium]|nr:lytic transglycosylase domain-containing protein [Actinomycetota bacterium]